MYANATEALEGLRHARTGKVLPSKNVARNTRLIYFADELVGLHLHNTTIATYRHDGVVFDFRGPGAPNGWFTDLTLRRAEEFTPVQFFRQDGLTYVQANPSFDLDQREPARLYAHGCYRTCNGSFENFIEPAIERRIAQIVANWNRKSANFAKRCVTRWRNFDAEAACCRRAVEAGEYYEHMIGHIERNEPVVTHGLLNAAHTSRQAGLFGDALAEHVAERMTEEYRRLRDHVVSLADPNFPFPQFQRDTR